MTENKQLLVDRVHELVRQFEKETNEQVKTIMFNNSSRINPLVTIALHPPAPRCVRCDGPLIYNGNGSAKPAFGNLYCFKKECERYLITVTTPPVAVATTKSDDDEDDIEID